MTQVATTPAITLLTCSFSGDLEMCRLLCESVDRFVPENIGHTLYVPARDVPLFAEFATSRRTIATQEELLPRWFWKLPMPGPDWRRRLHLPRRNVYLTPYSLPVRGWIAQQIMKLAATLAAQAEIVVHVDSDNAFIRPLSPAHLMRGHQARIYRNPEMVDLPGHRLWHAAAGRLLGLPAAEYYGAEYIDQLVVWRRSVVEALIARIEAVTGQGALVYLQYGPSQPEFLQLAGKNAEGFVWSTVLGVYADEKGRAFREKYKKRFPGKVMGLCYTGSGYDIVNFLAQAWTAVGDPDKFAAVNDYIRKTPFRGVCGWSYLNNARQEGVHYPVGTDDLEKGMAQLYFQVQNGEHKIIYPNKLIETPFRPASWM